jgi:hypothetical protein
VRETLTILVTVITSRFAGYTMPTRDFLALKFGRSRRLVTRRRTLALTDFLGCVKASRTALMDHNALPRDDGGTWGRVPASPVRG